VARDGGEITHFLSMGYCIMKYETQPDHFPIPTQRELAMAIRHIEDLRIISMGDSSVFGVGDHGNDIPSVGYGWTGRLAHDLNAKRFINVAKNGARARHLPANQLPAVLAFRPHIALVCIGTNDVLRGDFSIEEIRGAVEEISKSVVALGSLVVILGLPDPLRTAPGPLVLRRILSTRVLALNEMLLEIAEDGYAIFIPTWESKIAHERKMWHVDRMHPSAIGHQHIADLVRRKLSLPRRSASKIPTIVNRSKRFEIYWLITNGGKWFLKRSVDLIPALIWLVISESIRNSRNRSKLI
jgi:lysophospholipase L1-like esterase